MMPMDEDRVYGRGRRTIVRIDPTSQRPVPWTEGFRQVMSEWIVDGS